MKQAIILLIACLITYCILSLIGGFLIGCILLIFLIAVGFLLAAIWQTINAIIEFFEPKKPP